MSVYIIAHLVLFLAIFLVLDGFEHNLDDSNYYEFTNDTNFYLKNTTYGVDEEVALIKGPYNANNQSRYVEIVLVFDYDVYVDLNKRLADVHAKAQNISLELNVLYTKLNIFIALTDVVVWTDGNPIDLSSDSDKSLKNFLHYRKSVLNKNSPNDYAQLITKKLFDGGIVRKSLVGPICSSSFSGGIVAYTSSNDKLLALSIAHSLGHNLGMLHDTEECNCPENKCIMSQNVPENIPTHWSECSIANLNKSFSHGMDYCLRNKPIMLFKSPVCGNGFVELGEECDCGLPDQCDNPCCSASTCTLYPNASCASGECCDLNICQIKTAGNICRSAHNVCDLSEYCDGVSEYCPKNGFSENGVQCKENAFCYQGTCQNRDDQCKLLWGPTGESSLPLCYDHNIKGTRHGDCGYNLYNDSFIRCHNDDIMCGRLSCSHMSEELQFGFESVSILSSSFVTHEGSVAKCRRAVVDFGVNDNDPGLVPNGAQCAQGKMCVNQKCVAAESLLTANQTES